MDETISREMISEGLGVYEHLKETYAGEFLVVEIYKAMRSVDPSDRHRAKAEKGQCEVPNACSDD